MARCIIGKSWQVLLTSDQSSNFTCSKYIYTIVFQSSNEKGKFSSQKYGGANQNMGNDRVTVSKSK